MTTILNPTNPYHCDCGAPLENLMMQHFSKRTIVLGACSNPTCPNYLSHKAAEVIEATERTRAVIEAIARKWSVNIGVFEYQYAQMAKAV